MNKNVYIETLGCQMNKSDSERIFGILSQCGYSKCDDSKDADLLIVNTCNIRQLSADKAYSLLGKWCQRKKEHPDIKIAICGCVAQQDKEQIRLGKVSGIGAGTEQIQNRAHKDVNDDRVGSAQQQRKIEGKAGEGVDTRGVAAAHGDGYAGACAGADHAAESRENRGNRHAQGEGGYLIAVSRLPDKVDIRHIVQYHDQNGQHGGNTHLCHQSPYGFRGEDFLRKFVLF